MNCNKDVVGVVVLLLLIVVLITVCNLTSIFHDSMGVTGSYLDVFTIDYKAKGTVIFAASGGEPLRLQILMTAEDPTIDIHNILRSKSTFRHGLI